MTNQDLIEHLKMHGFLSNEPIERAFSAIDRADFVKDKYKILAYEDIPLPIGFGQTISQPATVATMMELLDPRGGQKILDIGYGSGYTSALLATITGAGKVFAIEMNPEIADWGRNNLNKYNFINDKIIETIIGDGSQGLPAEAPFDRILVSAASDKDPQELKNQLEIGGILVFPSTSGLVKIIRKSEKEFTSSEFSGFVFVPLIQDNNL